MTTKTIKEIKQPANRPNIVEADIENGNTLYEGEYCDVVEVVKGDHVYAVKCIYKERIQKAYYQKQIKQISNEIAILYKCKHQNIIELLGHFENEQMIALFFPKFGKTLQSFIKIKKQKEGSAYTLEIFLKIFRQIGEAMKQLHCLGFVHRDICPENILMNKDYEIKLIDFGCASPIWGRKTKMGTIEYMAPQMLEARAYNHKIDIWALGILCYELLYGTYPFQPKKKHLTDQQMEKQYIKLMMEPIEQFSEENLIITEKPPLQMIDTIKCFLNFNPDKRPEIGAVLCKRVFGAQEEDSRIYEVQMLRFKTQRKTNKLPGNLNLNVSQMCVFELENALFSLVSLHSNQLLRQKQLLDHLIKSEKKLADLRIQRYSKKQ